MGLLVARSSLLGFDWIFEFEDVDVQCLPVLAHVTEHYGSSFIEMGI